LHSYSAHSPHSTEPSLPSEIAAVQKYILEKDYPEVIGGQQFKTRVENALSADLTNDGHKQVVIQYFPHYRQSAPIVIYRVDGEKRQVARVMEGLAPGPLQSISGDYLDSHESGMALDISLAGDLTDPAKRESLIGVSLQNFSGVVVYPKFAHLDSRTGPTPSYVDMTSVSMPPDWDNCRKFEFSHVRQIAVGSLQDDATNYLAAWVAGQIYLYRIKAFLPNGRLDKTLSIQNAPAGFQCFLPGPKLSWKTSSGKVQVLKLE